MVSLRLARPSGLASRRLVTVRIQAPIDARVRDVTMRQTCDDAVAHPRGGTYRIPLASRRGDVLGRIAMSNKGKHIVALAALSWALLSPVRAQDSYPSR